MEISCKAMERPLPLKALENSFNSWCVPAEGIPGDVECLWDLGKIPFKDRYENQLLKVFGFLVFLRKKAACETDLQTFFILYYILNPAVY